MTRQDLWSAIMGSDGEQISLAEEVGRSSFDDQLEINLRTGGYRMLHHLEDKYVGNTECRGAFCPSGGQGGIPGHARS